jgi:phosphodiesterase/alkaline phosphatase D-like protein
MGGAGLALPGLWSASSCAPAVINPDTGTGLSFGYVCGDVGSESALVWLRAAADSRVNLRYGKEPGLAQFQSTSVRTVDAGADQTAIFSLDGLTPSTRYYYRATVEVSRGAHRSFVTAPRPDDNARMRVLL